MCALKSFSEYTYENNALKLFFHSEAEIIECSEVYLKPTSKISKKTNMS